MSATEPKKNILFDIKSNSVFMLDSHDNKISSFIDDNKFARSIVDD